MSDVAVILQELSALKELVKDLTAASKEPAITPRWLSLSDACKYSNMSKNTLRPLLVSGEIYGFQKTTEKGNGGNWTVDRESIDDYQLQFGLTSNAKYVDFQKRVGIK